jgi:hypothetical protein
MIRLLYVLLFSVCIEGAEKKDNFSVVVVTGDVKDGQGRSIQALSSLTPKTMIDVSSNGYIALIDVRNNLFEFHGPARIILQKLAGRSRAPKFTPDLAILYADSIHRKAIWNERNNDAPFFIAPLGYSQSFGYSGDTLCLQWLRKADAAQAQVPGRYLRLFMTDEFGDTVMTRVVSGNSYCYAFPQEYKKQKTVYIIGLKEKQKIAGEPVKIEYLTAPLSFNDTTDPTSPVVNVMYGLFLEEQGMFQEALVYYQRANDRGGAVEEYARILERFRKRWKLS